MKVLEQESEEAMKEFYSIKKVHGVEIPSCINTIEKRRIWAYHNGYTTIGYYNFIWYAYNN